MSNKALFWAGSWDREAVRDFSSGRSYPGPIISVGCRRCCSSFHPMDLEKGMDTEACPGCGFAGIKPAEKKPMTDYSEEKKLVEKADAAKWRILHRHCTYDCKRKDVCERCPIGKQLEDLHTEMSNG